MEGMLSSNNDYNYPSGIAVLLIGKILVNLNLRLD